MSTQLILRQSLNSGQTRTWRLRPAQGTLSYGASRLADLISCDPHTAGIEAVFQYKEGHWVCIQMLENTASSDNSAVTVLRGVGSIKIGQQEISYTTVERDETLLKNLEEREYSLGSKAHRLVVLKKLGRIVATQVLPAGSPLPPHLNSQDLEIFEKNINLEDIDHLSEQKISDYINQNSKKETGAVLAVTGLFMLAAILGPRTQAPEVFVPPQRVATQITLKTEKKQIKKEEKKQAPSSPLVAQNTKAPQGNPTKSAVTKSFVGGRLSQLIGKVSSQAAKSANVVVATGKVAGSGPSGRALAAVGPVDRSGTDWGAQGKAGPTGVSTAGQAGGKGLAGLSGLSRGSTGSAGVGLIEDESEVSGGLDPDVIAQYIKSQLGQILYCYERQLSAQPDLFGKVAVKFTIGPNGGVETRAINTSTLKNNNVEGCILSKVAAWKFPAPQGGTRVLVTYPFLFKSTN